MLEVVYEDNHLLVVVKPPNLLTQGDKTGDPSLLNEAKGYIKERYHKPGEVYLGLVHRMDRPVGGLVALARTSKAAARLSEQLRTHAMRRDYLAVVRGGAIPDALDLCDWLLMDEAAGRVRAVAPETPGAKEARLHLRALGRDGGTALVHVSLETGRKHQIRAQLAHAGFPILYDARYGEAVPGQPVALWGAALSFRHPTRGEPMQFTSAPRGEAFACYQDAIRRFLDAYMNTGEAI